MPSNLPSNTTSNLPIVHAKDGRVYANSRDVAAYFGKRHADVLRAVDNLECSEEFSRRNFASCQSPHPTVPGRMDRSVDMTRDGFTFLVMGFNGKEAARFKEAYITAFNAMEERLREAAKPALPDFRNPADAARAWADEYDQKLVAQEEVKRLAPLALVGERAVSRKNHTLAECSRTFQGVNTMKVAMALAEKGYLYRSAANKGYRVRAAYRDTLFEERLHEASGNRTIIVTPRGKVELEKLYQRGQLPLKKGFQHAH